MCRWNGKRWHCLNCSRTFTCLSRAVRVVFFEFSPSMKALLPNPKIGEHKLRVSDVIGTSMNALWCYSVVPFQEVKLRET